MFPCFGCSQCLGVIRGEYITRPQTGKRFPLCFFFTCESSFVDQRIRDRISKHKSKVRCQNLLLPVPHRFFHSGLNVSQMRFKVIEQIPIPRRGGNRVKHFKK